MLYRILPILSVVAIIGVFIFINHQKRVNNTLYLGWSKKTSYALGGTILFLHAYYMIYYLVVTGAFLYLQHADLCTMLYPWVSIALLWNKKKMLRILMPLSILGGVFELASQQMTFAADTAFDDVLLYVKHLLLIFAGLYIYNNQKNYLWKYFGYSMWWLVGFVVYILMTVGIPHWVTGDDRFGAYSMGLLESSYHDVDVSWTGKMKINATYSILNSFKYPFGTIDLYIVAVIFVSFFTIGTYISSRYKIKQTKWVWN